MEIRQDDYILGFWFGSCHTEIPSSDFLMTALKRNDEWNIEYRFRYHMDHLRGPESRDRKTFYGFKTKQTESVLMENLERFISMVKKKYTDLEFHEVRGDADKWQYVMAQCDFSIIRPATPEEASRKEERNAKSDKG